MQPSNTTNTIHPRQVIRLVLKHRWLVIVPFCLAMATGIYLALVLPKKYRSETLILVQPQKVPTSFVQPIVTSGIDARINSISQQILSRTNLEKIIDEFKLFSDSRMYMEEKVETLRKRIEVEVSKDERRVADAFTISFVGENPQTVMRVVSTLAAYFIDENLKTRETQAVSTSGFLEEELVSIRGQLEAQEERLKKYREAHMGALPEQLDTNFRVLDRLRLEIGVKREALQDANNRLAVLQKQIAEQKKLYPGLAEVDLETPPPAVGPVDVKEARLEALKLALNDLRARYTNKHPDVLRSEREIAELESKLEPKAESPPAPVRGRIDLTALREREDRLKQREALKLKVATTIEEIKRLQKQVTEYQKRIEETPKREQELLALKRDYQNVKDTYDNLLGRKLEAQIAVNMEKKQKGEQFRILDPARLAKKPVEPDMKKIFLICLLAGLGAGAGLTLMRESYDSSFKDIADIESYLELPVMTAIPVLYDPRDALWRRVNLVFSSIFTVISLTLLAGLILITVNGIDQTLEFINQII